MNPDLLAAASVILAYAAGAVAAAVAFALSAWVHSKSGEQS